MVVVERVPQAVINHGIDQSGIAHAESVARIRQYMCRRAHILLSTGDDDVRITASDGLRREHHGFQPRAAHFIDGHGRNGVRQTGFNHGLARRVLPSTGGQNLPQNHFVYRLRRHARLRHQRLNHRCAQFRRRDFGQRATKFTDGRAFGRDNDNWFHLFLTSLKNS